MWLEKLRAGEITCVRSKRTAITRRSESGPAPLSYNQEQIYLQAQLASQVAPDSRLFNETITIHPAGPVDLQVLERSLLEILRRHEAWRTTFENLDGTLIQRVNTRPELDLDFADLRHAAEPERAALEVAQARARQPFDLARGPLVRFQLTQLKEQEYRLFLTAHQIVLDGVSAYHVFLPELVAFYKAFASGTASPLPEPNFQYPDYAQWQRRALANGQLSEHLDYWQKQLSGNFPVLQMPTDQPRPAVQSFRGAIQPFAMPKKLSESARALTRAEGSTLFITLLAAFAALLHNYTEQEEIVIGTVAPTRTCSEIECLLGYFLNPVVLRLRIIGNSTFRGVVAQTREVVVGALSHAEMPFHLLARAIEPETNLSRHPLYQVQFSLEPPVPTECQGWNLTPMDLQTGGARLDLYFVLDDRPDGMFGRVQYNPDLFAPASMSRMVRHYQALLQAAVADPGAKICSLPHFCYRN